MYDIKWLRENPELLDIMLKKRNMEPLSHKILELDEEVRQKITLIQTLNAARKKKAANLHALGNNKRSEAYVTLYKDAEHIKHKIAILESEQNAQEELDYFLARLPNMLDENVPIGRSEKDNLEIRRWGQPKNYDFPIKAHYEISKNDNQIDFVLAANMSGSRFAILKNEMAQLERALANFMLDVHTKEFGYMEYSVPFMVLDESMYGAGQLPKFEADSFKVEGKYRLIPTGEVPLVNLVKNQLIEEGDLPLRFVAHTPCFRSEAGSAGRDTKGMIRLHQFSKVELVALTSKENIEEEHERLTSNAEEILKRLEIPYRVMLLCSGDMSALSKKTYDLEAWVPSQNQYREISSCSNIGDYQARRLNAKVKSKDGEKYFPHLLNGSALAVGRTMVALLENHQNSDGSINIPEALRPYVKKDIINV